MGETALQEQGQAGAFQSYDGVNIYEHWWRPVREPKASIVLVHGLQEHSGRYLRFAQFLTENGYAVDALDQRGHGKSNGITAFVRTFDDYVADLEAFCDRVRERLPGKPTFLMGFSMGGTVASLYTLKRKPPLRGLILSAPAIKLSKHVSNPLLEGISAQASKLFPKLPTVKMKSRHLSRDPEVVAAYDNDPLVSRRGVLLKTGSEFVKAMKFIQTRMEEFSLPMLILHGTQDKLVDQIGSQWLYDRAKCGDRTLKLYEGYFHEVINDTGAERVHRDILDWLNSHVRCDDR
jgi:alpha-beta hydrolase superfamily lysophospholipase